MRHLFVLFLLSLVLMRPCHGEPVFDQGKLAGEWRYDDEQQHQTARYIFRADGTFTAELRQGDELVRKFGGRWAFEEGMIVYTYESDSLGRVEPGMRERDRLERLDETSYTIEAGDGGHRTYWRVKENQ